MLLAGGVSVAVGVAFVILATGDHPKLRALAIYAATGAIEFLIQSWLLARRRAAFGPPRQLTAPLRSSGAARPRSAR